MMFLNRAILLGLVFLLAAGCTNQSTSQGTAASPSPSAASALISAPASAVAVTSPVAAAPSVQVAFTDIAGVYGEQAIRDEATLGILDSTSGTFQPNAPISRALFVRWLVKANNVYYGNRAASQIRLAQTGNPTFVDVPAANADFQYIQGLANAGYVIGVDATHFAPSRLLTREEMVAIKAPLDSAPTLPSYASSDIPFSDAAKVSKPYRAAIGADVAASGGNWAYTSGNLGRVYGTLKTLQPQKTVTRSEAAIALSAVGVGNSAPSASAALGRTPPP